MCSSACSSTRGGLTREGSGAAVSRKKGFSRARQVPTSGVEFKASPLRPSPSSSPSAWSLHAGVPVCVVDDDRFRFRFRLTCLRDDNDDDDDVAESGVEA